MNEIIQIRMPTPPSVNKAYKNIPRGRAKSQDYANWLLTAYQMIKACNPSKNHGRVGVCIGVERESYMSRADLDNRAKLILDALVSSGVLLDDYLVTFLVMCWLPASSGLSHVQIFSADTMPTFTVHTSNDGATGSWEFGYNNVINENGVKQWEVF